MTANKALKQTTEPNKVTAPNTPISHHESQPSKELIDYREAARRLKLCRRSVELLVKRGEIPHIKIGRSVRFDWNSVIKALTKHSVA
ncbi:helix-turn-helix transcriptional regulator [Rubritalea sp.]|uniref:helix-turn-helix transcriptional regulator n=1 Tax=Rubritalea sp. TaxID=2109375 RepID=UPI003EF4F0E5